MPDAGLTEVSVCVPTRNGARELPHTLRNLLERTQLPRHRFEVVIGNHESTDSTAAVVAEWQGKFPQLRCITVPFGAPNRARVRNALVREARGRLIVFIDHDVLVSDRFLEQHIEAHRRFPGALVAGQTYGKGIVKRTIEDPLNRLDLDHISTSESVLSQEPELADPRTRPGWISGDGPFADLTGDLAPFRFFWTCNVSAMRADILECGLFDESYDCWGLEDDDFAHQFYSRGKSMIFARSAWGFHVPHAVDSFRNIVSWRKNMDHFSRKFATREVEFFSVHGSELASGARRLGWLLSMLKTIDSGAIVRAAAPLLTKRDGRRSCHFLSDLDAAQRIEATDVFDPFVPLKMPGWQREGIRFWPHLGFRTPLPDQAIDESVLIVDVVMLLDRFMLLALLGEVARIAKRVVFIAGGAARDPGYAFAVQTLRQVTGLFRFEQITWIDTAGPSTAPASL